MSNINTPDTHITFEALLESAGALQLTQYGLAEAKHYKNFRIKEASFVVSCLRVIERANKNAIFIYPKGTVQPIKEAI